MNSSKFGCNVEGTRILMGMSLQSLLKKSKRNKTMAIFFFSELEFKDFLTFWETCVLGNPFANNMVFKSQE